jgi:ATP-dependent Clp protease ATP-binding subunit ClpC
VVNALREGETLTDTFHHHDPATQRVLSLAGVEAHSMGHPYVGAEHLVLGMLRDGDGLAQEVMTAKGVTLGAWRTEVLELLGRGSSGVTDDVETTPRAEKILHRAATEAALHGDHTVDSAHLLVALINDGGGPATDIFARLGVDTLRLAGAALAALERRRNDARDTA